MLKNKLVTAGFVILSALPLFAQADIHVNNETDAYGTGEMTYSPCSSSAGDKGIAKPHSVFTVSDSVINAFCWSSSCDAEVYASKDCSGDHIATITIDTKKGVTHIKNRDKDHYQFSGSGSTITIEPVSGLKHWFNFLF